ncbi:unnamed protein product [Debaryomyces fabryi]|nr:unnamed protein product [Debaryomyces fabryi]
MSLKLRKPSTPNKNGNKINGPSSGSGSKKKQLSLMSFFKPATKPGQESSPLKSKINNEVKDGSDKENENSMLEDTQLTDTPLTSETSAAVDTTCKISNPEFPKSSPVKEEKQQEIPKKPLSDSSNNAVLNSSPVSKRRPNKSISYAGSDVEEDTNISSVSRKRRKIVESDDDEDEFNLEDVEDDQDDDMSDFIADDNEESEIENGDDDDEDVVEEEEIAIRKSKKKSKTVAKSEVKEGNVDSVSPDRSSLGSKFKANSSYIASSNSLPKPKVSSPSSTTIKNNKFSKENEERYQWLVNIKDAEKRTPDDPNYDSRTLFVPSSAWSKFTAFEKQYWEIKSKMWDTVVFFKKGKFYELYENDAMIANSQFDLKIAGGGRANMKLAGIPEMSFDYWAKEFINLGYKVARVDQKETLLAKEMRGGSTKEEKIIKRELTGVLTGGTLTDLNMISDDMSIYCLSIKEEQLDDGSKVFGIAFVDTATSELNLIEFSDDNECTKLDTLITQIRPKEVLCEKNNLCSIANKILKFNAHNSNQIWNNLNPISEFWDYDSTLENLVKSKYYEAEDLDDYSHFPKILVNFKDNHKCAFNAFGGLLYYLKSLKLDESIMTLGNIDEYVISKNTSKHLILDGVTLNNLEILNNSFDGGEKGTLFKLVNRAITPFGKRMLKHWILHPLMKIDDINERYDSIDYLMGEGSKFREILEQAFNGLPDLERLLARIHSKTLRFKDFLRVVESFEKISKLIVDVRDFSDRETGSLHKFVNNFPVELESSINEWDDAFDRQEAMRDIVVPMKGIDNEFDESHAKINALEGELNEHLMVYKKQYKSNEICYKDSGKEIFLIEVPNKIKNIPKDWQQMGSTSKVKRFWSPEVRKLVRELMEQKELHKMVCETLKFRMYEKFNKHYSIWMSAIRNIANIDCLIALTKVSESIGYPSCRPEFEKADKGLIEFKELRHPCFIGTKDFIPNDICLGGSEPNFGLLTGANAAGKSTIMRTTALAIILSQIGCYVPASLARLNPIDRIMTRLGANDNIMQGKSTFFVELSETKKILSNATPNSLVILDELGRGGSSSDGYSIAESVLYQLATHIQSLGFFATHYGSLGLSFRNHPQIKPLRMAILIDDHSRNITFLYKLEQGAAPGSFGMNVASMCGISNEIVDKAEIAAKEYEQTSRIKRQNDISNSNLNNMSLGLQSDFVWLVNNYKKLSEDILDYDESVKQNALNNIFSMVENL